MSKSLIYRYVLYYIYTEKLVLDSIISRPREHHDVSGEIFYERLTTTITNNLKFNPGKKNNPTTIPATHQLNHFGGVKHLY